MDFHYLLDPSLFRTIEEHYAQKEHRWTISCKVAVIPNIVSKILPDIDIYELYFDIAKVAEPV